MAIQASFWNTVDAVEASIQGFSAGYDERLYVVLSPTKRARRKSRRILSIGADDSFECPLSDEVGTFHYVQPFENGLLLVDGRCLVPGTASGGNAHVISSEGAYVRSILFGDGIEYVQTTESGEIWVGYFDEGVLGYGNYGWQQPIGASGLVRFSSAGERVFEYQPLSVLDRIIDCYTLNVSGPSDAWCSYYTEFPIVEIHNDQIQRHWNSPIRGPRAFAVWRDRVLMDGGYEDHDRWTLLTLLTNGQVEQSRGPDSIVDTDGAPLLGCAATARGPNLWLIKDTAIWHVDLRKLKFIWKLDNRKQHSRQRTSPT